MNTIDTDSGGSKLKAPKILFVHNTAIWYRRPFFKKLSEIYDIKFIFTHTQLEPRHQVDIPGKIEGLEGVKYKVLKSYSNIVSPYGIAFNLVKELFREDYDVLVCGLQLIDAICCIVAAKLRRKSLIGWTEGWEKRPLSLRRKLTLPLIESIIRPCDALLVPGTKHKEHAVSLGVSPEKVFISPNASNLYVRDRDYATKKQLKRQLDIGNKKAILFVGRLVKIKGVEYLIQAFAKLKKEREAISLIIVGSGECKEELELLCQRFYITDDVHFLGFVENSELPPYYLLCGVCVVPSITYGQTECWGFVVNEAMHCGKPVIATDAVGAAFDMIRDGENGFMVPEKDADALYEAMKKIITTPEMEQKMGEESKRIVEQGFRYEHMISGFRKAVEYVTGDYERP